MEQDQGMLAPYASGSLGGAMSAQPETGGTSGRGARGGSRARQRTPAPSSSGADEGDSLGMSFPLVNEDGKPLVSCNTHTAVAATAWCMSAIQLC